jgi:signal transduction histidine kinase/ActR/RegA family two-component response regulator
LRPDPLVLPAASAPQRPPAQASLSALQVLSLLCVLLPLVAYLAVGTFRYQQLRGETEVRLDRALRIAQEHALKVLDTNETLLARVADSVSTLDAAQIEARAPVLHQQLKAVAARRPQIQAIWLWGPDGRGLATSRWPSVPKESHVGDRPYFLQHRDGRVEGVQISEPMTSKVVGQRFFTMSMARQEPGGGFGGIVSVNMRPDYFEQFHADLVNDEPGLAVTMLRADGMVLSRWPKLANAPARLSPGSPVMKSIGQGVQGASMTGVSSIDGRERLLNYQRIGDFPIYIGTGMDVAEIRGRWLQEMAWLAAFGIPPMLGLFLAARLALRRSREAVEAGGRLQEESEARRRVEEALVQAQKLEALGRLTGGVAHDFNNALMVISNNLVLLKMKHPQAAGKYVDSIGRAVGSATKLTRQLLAFSRRQALVPEHVDLRERLPTVRDLLAPVLGSRVQLSIEVDPATRPIRVDAAEFELGLLNLAINARDALRANGRLAVRARNAAPGELPPLLEGLMVLVEVEDNGSGIPPEVLQRVFEPFFTTKPVGEGTGLGLSQVYGLCQRAGGTAAIESELGRGTTVKMFFPPDSKPAVPDSTAPSLARGLGLDLVMVEDNREVAAALGPVLETMGCRVRHFDRAPAARDWLAAARSLPDVLLTDVVMPGEMDGVALAREVRERWPGIHVIVMTGYAQQMDTLEQMGFDVLPKPCTPEMIAQALARTLEDNPRRGMAAAE